MPNIYRIAFVYSYINFDQLELLGIQLSISFDTIFPTNVIFLGPVWDRGSFCLAFWSQTRIAFWLQIPVSGRGRLMRDPVPVGGVIPLSLDLMRHLGPALDGAPGGGGRR